ncbi:MAG: RDD family protein [Spirulina sp.]
MSLFRTITIRTPESIELEFVLAGIGSRAVALVVDYLCLGMGILALSLLYSFLLIQVFALESVLSTATETIQLWITAIFLVLLFALYIGYFVLFETLWFGQSPGKRYTKIRVIRDDGQPERIMQATLRSLLRPVDDILFLGFFCILLTPQEKRLGDWLAGTLVVQVDPNSGGKITIPERSQAIGQDLLALADMAKLSPDDLATIRDFLQRRATLSPKAKHQVSDQMARRYRDQIGLETLPTEMTTDTFLEALYWAYQQGNRS